MKPPTFDYLRAQGVDHALDLLEEHGDEAKVVAGGQSLVPLLNLRLARPGVLVDVNDLVELDTVERSGDELRTGALVRHRRLCADPVVSAASPMLSTAARFIGHAAIRNRGTLGGSIAHADPSAELPLVAVACGATISVRSAAGQREVPAEEFFQGPFMTTLEPEEIVSGVRWPAFGPLDSWGYAQVAERSGDFAEAAAGVTLLGDRLRVVIAGLPGSPLRLPGVETWLSAMPESLDQLREVTQETLRDQLGAGQTEEYSRNLVTEMVFRAVGQTWDRRRAA